MGRAGATRVWSHRRVVALVAVAAMLAAAGCEAQMTDAVNNARSAAHVAVLPITDTLTTAARAHSQAMCSAGAVTPSVSPATSYQEGTYVIHELVGRALLDTTIADPTSRNVDATDAIWLQWEHDQLTDPHWVDQADGEVTCPDGYLYETLVLRQVPNAPVSGLYVSQQYPVGSGTISDAIQYGSAVDYSGTTIPLLLDLYVPPVAAPVPHPAIVLIHGGAFVGGSRSDYAGLAEKWSSYGYAVIAIDYRLDPLLNGPHTAADQLHAAANAIADAQESVRWLKAHAATYGIDTTRIAAVGDSAGGAIALGLSAVADQHPASPYSTYSPSVATAVSTGAYLTPGLEAGLLHLTGTEAPILMFHYETDAASAPGPYAYETCTDYHLAGDTCDYVSQAGEGHTTDLSPGGQWWTNPIAPFLWSHLRLGT
jgi:dienelactone hydrolase